MNLHHPYKKQVDASRNPSDGERHDGFWEIVEYDHDDSSIGIYFAASTAQPVLVKEVLHIVEDVFGASATIDVGDGTDADYWLAQSDIGQNSAGNMTASLLAAVPRAGRWYTSGGQIKVTVGGTHTAGRGRLLAYLIRL
jgi:hypothetical protein